MTSKADELAVQLAAMKADLEETQRELDRANREKEKPEGIDAFINAVSKVNLPTFWEADPVLWFRQCESAFRRHGANISSGVKFDHVVGKLPNSVSLSCRSLLLDINFEDTDAYERLKAHLCKNFGKSKWQMGYALLDSPGLGDRRPSQLLQDMRAMLPPNEAEGTIFQCLFLKKLPTQMSDAIMAANLEEIEAMAEMADRLFDRPATPSVAAVSQCCQHVAAVDSKRTGRQFDRAIRQCGDLPHQGKNADPTAALSSSSVSGTDRFQHGRQEQRKTGVTHTSISGTGPEHVTHPALIRKTR
jgi:hypothetical protein